jgi:hypothetical protein
MARNNDAAIDPSILAGYDEEQKYMASTKREIRQIKPQKGESYLLRFLPVTLGPRKTWFARTAKHWWNRKPIMCPKHTSVDFGGFEDQWCPICDAVEELRDSNDDISEKVGDEARGTAVWTVYALAFEREDGRGKVKYPEEEIWKPWSLDLYKAQFDELYGMISRYASKSAPKSFLDPQGGRDIWLTKKKDGKLRFDPMDPAPISEDMSEEFLSKLLDVKLPKIQVPTDEQLKLFARKIKDAAERGDVPDRGDRGGSSRDDRGGRGGRSASRDEDDGGGRSGRSSREDDRGGRSERSRSSDEGDRGARAEDRGGRGDDRGGRTSERTTERTSERSSERSSRTAYAEEREPAKEDDSNPDLMPARGRSEERDERRDDRGRDDRGRGDDRREERGRADERDDRRSAPPSASRREAPPSAGRKSVGEVESTVDEDDNVAPENRDPAPPEERLPEGDTDPRSERSERRDERREEPPAVSQDSAPKTGLRPSLRSRISNVAGAKG